MGLLIDGRPLTWSEILPVRSALKKYIINDLILILEKHLNRKNDPFLWGDEVESSIIRFDHKNKRVQVSLKADKILSKIKELSEDENNSLLSEIRCHAEDCNFVIETTPSKPYTSNFNDFNQVQSNMQLRREQTQKLLDKDEYIMTISLFPRLGCVGFTYPEYKVDPTINYDKSITCPIQLKTPNSNRSISLDRNTIERRQSKVSVNIPIYKDLKTSNPFIDDFSLYDILNWKEHLINPKNDFIHIESSSMGWACCCLQVTFQGESFYQTIHLYDQLIPLTPIFLGLSCGCPIWRGYLSDIDSRWNILSEISDDRTKEEIEKNLLHNSRYSSIYYYLSPTSEIYNDIKFNYDQDLYQTLLKYNCPSTVARHFSYLILRDPLCITDDQLNSNDQTNISAFENHNSTIWNSLRFKPPPPKDITSLGWRVEFRPMELQITDFENAALVVFLSLLTRAILSFNIDLRIPISLVIDNMNKAQQRDSIHLNKFHFSIQIFKNLNENKFHSSINNQTREMSMDEIINGSKNFLGLKSLVLMYLNSFEDIDIITRLNLNNYVEFISERAKGNILTNAMFIRKFIDNHPEYKHDSIVNEKIQYDLLQFIQQINNQ